MNTEAFPPPVRPDGRSIPMLVVKSMTSITDGDGVLAGGAYGAD